MKKIKGKLAKRTSQTQLVVNHHSTGDWTKYDERLIECVENGDFERLRATLSKKGTSAVKINENGTTALHTACLVGNIDCLDVLLEEQPDLSFVNKSGCSPLHVAAQAGNTECVQRILQHKVHVGSQDGKKMTALHHAAAKGHLECVELLMNNNAPLNGKDKDGRTPLLMAIQGAHESVAKRLLERGAKVNIADNSKKTALMYASLLGLTKSVEILLKRGANSKLTDSNDHTAEDYARLCQYQGIIELIHNAPSIATWDAGETSEDTEQEEDTSIPNGEIVSEFSSLEESEADASVTLHRRAVSNNVPSSVNSGSLSPQESFSSKTSTTLSSPRVVNQDLTEDIKELEEENEMLNQELNKLRVQHQKTMERLRRLEDQWESKKSEATETVTTNHVNGHIEEELLEEKDKRIGELETEVEKLKDLLKKETVSRNEAEAEVETLKVQVASYQDDITGDFNSSDSDEDIDLPGVEHQLDMKKNNKMPKSTSNQSEQLISLHGQITTLKLENETLKQQLKQQTVNGDFIDTQNDPTIPLTVYQQLKESNEDEIFKLTEELEELKIRNEALEKSMAGKGECLHCNRHINKSSKLPSNNAEQLLSLELTNLKERFEMAETEHRDTVNRYRIQLLNACQGELDPDIQDALQMIIKLRSSEQFC